MTRDRDWLVLLSAPGIGAATLRSVAEGSAVHGQLLDVARRRLSADGNTAALQWIDAPDAGLVEDGLRWLAQPDRHLVAWGEDDYPPQLQEIAQPPAALFVRGDPAALWMPQLAIVGSRHASRGGIDNARAFAGAVARAGLVVTSGLALGIDGAAHGAALEAGGLTVAVAATGLDQVYPPRHAELCEEIARHGAVVSEFPPGTPPRRSHFPRRNRIIAGLAAGTLVVEASVRSGSLITARQAMQENREVFAIPGSIHNPLARGCHRLIKEGAKLVETAADLLDELGGAVLGQAEAGREKLRAGPRPGSPETPRDPDYQRLLEAIGHDPVSVDRLVLETGLTVEVLSSMLLILELDGHVESGPGGSYCRIGEEFR